MLSPTVYFNEFENGIIEISKINKTPYSIKILYANVITLMESYLHFSFIDIVKRANLYREIFETKRYKNESIKFSVIFSQNEFDIKNHVIDNLLNKILYHDTSSISISFKEILGIRVNLNGEIIDAIDNRHHIVHRNGKDLNGDAIEISENNLNKLIDVVREFLRDIDNQILDKFF